MMLQIDDPRCGHLGRTKNGYHLQDTVNYKINGIKIESNYKNREKLSRFTCLKKIDSLTPDNRNPVIFTFEK